MFKFFKTIRQNLIKNNKVKNYILYALGEIILVVIGILIALSINNWNEHRKERIKEVNLLRQLDDELRVNLNQLEMKIAMRANMLLSSQHLLSVIDGDANYSDDSLNLFIHRTIYAPTFNTIENDLITANKLELIHNDTLRIRLAHWPSEVDQLLEEEIAWLTYRNTLYYPFLTENFRSRDLYYLVQKDLEMTNLLFLEEYISSDYEIGYSKNKSQFVQLLSHEDFEDHLAYLIIMNNIANIQSHTLKERLEYILQLIHRELKKR